MIPRPPPTAYPPSMPAASTRHWLGALTFILSGTVLTIVQTPALAQAAAQSTTSADARAPATSAPAATATATATANTAVTAPIALPAVTVRGFGFPQEFASTSGSLAVLQADTIEAMNLTELSDLNGRVPGFALVSSMTGGPRYAYIRGIGDFHELWGRSVAVNIDGVPQSLIELQNPGIAGDVERIEILKGPQQILNGSHGKAGAVDIYTRDPQQDEGTLRMGLGNDGYFNTHLGYHHILNDKLALGGSFTLERDDGWVRNLYNNSDKADKDRKQVALRAILTPSSSTRIALSAHAQNLHEGGPLLVAMNPDTMRPYSSYNSWTGTGGAELPFGRISHDTDDYTDSQTRGVNLNVRHDFGKVSLHSTTAWTTYRDNGLLDVDGGDDPLSGMVMVLSQDNTLFYQNLRLRDDTGSLRWIAGVDGYSNKYDSVKRYEGSPIDYGTRQTQKGFGFYGQLQWLVNERFDLMVGARYQTDTTEGVGKGTFEGQQLRVRDRTALFSGTATWHLTPKTHAYATLSQSYYPSGIYAIDAMRSYNKERGVTAEIGFKGQWLDDRLFGSIALYQNTIRDRVYTMEVPYSMWNIDKQRNRGFEAELIYRLTPSLEVGASYSQANPVILEWADHPELVGNKPMQLPLKQVNANLSYRTHTPIGLFRSRLDVSHTGSHYGDNANTYEADSYTLVDLSLSLQRKNHTVTLWGRNIFDKQYYALLSYSSPQYATGSYGRGRTFGLNYRLDF